jgi:tripartite-type tricarboxylate transporter receptor subunit TctC
LIFDRLHFRGARAARGDVLLKRSAIALVLGLIAAAPARAQSSVADFYKGRTIDVYVGLSAGGVYDISARLLARYMGKYIPGNPTLVTRNMEGAAGLRLANWLYQQAPKDGTAFGTFARGASFNALLGLPGAFFDANKFNWIGSTNDEVSICASWHTSGVTSIEQLYDKELIVGSTGGSGDDEQFPKILNGVLGTKIRTVSGYPGGNEIKMAMQRGEVNGRCGWSWSSVKSTEAQWLKDKTISIFVQLSLRKHPDLPDVPMIMDVAKTDEQRQIFKLIFARQVMAWPFAAPPGVPVDRVAALRKAFDDTLRDKEFLAEAEKLSLEITPVSGERIQSLIGELYQTTSPEVARKVGDMLK